MSNSFTYVNAEARQSASNQNANQNPNLNAAGHNFFWDAWNELSNNSFSRTSQSKRSLFWLECSLLFHMDSPWFRPVNHSNTDSNQSGPKVRRNVLNFSPANAIGPLLTSNNSNNHTHNQTQPIEKLDIFRHLSWGQQSQFGNTYLVGPDWLNVREPNSEQWLMVMKVFKARNYANRIFDAIHELCVGFAMNSLRDRFPTLTYTYGYALTSQVIRPSQKWLVEHQSSAEEWNNLMNPPSPALLTEFVDKSLSLLRWILQGGYREGQFMNLLAHVFGTLAVAYDQVGFIDQDLNPRNILVQHVTDFPHLELCTDVISEAIAPNRRRSKNNTRNRNPQNISHHMVRYHEVNSDNRCNFNYIVKLRSLIPRLIDFGMSTVTVPRHRSWNTNKNQSQQEMPHRSSNSDINPAGNTNPHNPNNTSKWKFWSNLNLFSKAQSENKSNSPSSNSQNSHSSNSLENTARSVVPYHRHNPPQPPSAQNVETLSFVGTMKLHLQEFHFMNDISQFLGHCVWTCFDFGSDEFPNLPPLEQLNRTRPVWETCIRIALRLHHFLMDRAGITRSMSMYVDLIALQWLYKAMYPVAGEQSDSGWDSPQLVLEVAAPDTHFELQYLLQTDDQSINHNDDINFNNNHSSFFYSNIPYHHQNQVPFNAYYLYVLALFESLCRFMEYRETCSSGNTADSPNQPHRIAPYVPRSLNPFRIINHFYSPTFSFWADMEEVYLKARMDPEALKSIEPLRIYVHAINSRNVFNELRQRTGLTSVADYAEWTRAAAHWLKSILPNVWVFLEKVLLNDPGFVGHEFRSQLVPNSCTPSSRQPPKKIGSFK